MRTIRNLHDFIGLLPELVQAEVSRLSTERTVGKDEVVYSQDDAPLELYRLKEGAVKLCHYRLDGRETVVGEFRPGDCFGEMGLIDGLPRGSHAVATRESRLSVLSKNNFEALYAKYPEISHQLNLMLCRRLRLALTLSEDAIGLKIHERLARVIHRLAYSHGYCDEQKGTYIDVSHEELSKMLGASRQSVSTQLKLLEGEGSIELRYGKIFIRDLDALGDKYEKAVGMEQVSALYEDK